MCSLAPSWVLTGWTRCLHVQVGVTLLYTYQNCDHKKFLFTFTKKITNTYTILIILVENTIRKILQPSHFPKKIADIYHNNQYSKLIRIISYPLFPWRLHAFIANQWIIFTFILLFSLWVNLMKGSSPLCKFKSFFFSSVLENIFYSCFF